MISPRSEPPVIAPMIIGAERTFPRNMEITDEFCNIEIGKVQEKWGFE